MERNLLFPAEGKEKNKEAVKVIEGKPKEFVGRETGKNRVENVSLQSPEVGIVITGE